jgi:hypothetical protein
MQLPALRPMAVIHEDKDLTQSRTGLRFQLFDEGVEIADVPATELVH